MPAILILVFGAVVVVLELMGVRKTKAGQVDTISEMWWWLTTHTSRPARWALNTALVGFMAWATVHLVCNCGV
jgi:hypothetical protein